MNILLLVDNKVNEAQLKQVKAEVTKLYKQNTGIPVRFFDEWKDLSNVPKEWYDGENEGISKAFIAKTTKEIYSRYGERIEHVVFFIHRDNWNLTGVWGWNSSKVFNNYGVQQCRFDNKNLANTVGTLYHELMHDHDTFVYTYLGSKIEAKVLVKDWDDDVVHGGKYSKTTYGWKYIRYNENQAALALIGTDLAQALVIRRKVFKGKEDTLIKEAIRLAQILVIKRRQAAVATRGDLAIKPNNLCSNYLASQP